MSDPETQAPQWWAAAARVIVGQLEYLPAAVLMPDDDSVVGATVTLLHSDDGSAGSFEPVPNGSGLMSAENRTNPDLTRGPGGSYGWEAVPVTARSQSSHINLSRSSHDS